VVKRFGCKDFRLQFPVVRSRTSIRRAHGGLRSFAPFGAKLRRELRNPAMLAYFADLLSEFGRDGTKNTFG
jgi:hypothetical protein